MRPTSTTASDTATTCVTNGHAIPAANSRAPRGGPTSWFAVSTPVWMRALPTPRSRESTSIGRSVAVVVSANTSATPYRKSTTRMTTMSTQPTTMATHSTATTTARRPSATMTTSRRSSRSATAPAHSPNSSHGRRCNSAASETSTALRVCEATSSGPAASATPSPMLLTHEEATSHRKDVPMRGGSTRSRSGATRDRRYRGGATRPILSGGAAGAGTRRDSARRQVPARPRRRARQRVVTPAYVGVRTRVWRPSDVGLRDGPPLRNSAPTRRRVGAPCRLLSRNTLGHGSVRARGDPIAESVRHHARAASCRARGSCYCSTGTSGSGAGRADVGSTASRQRRGLRRGARGPR